MIFIKHSLCMLSVLAIVAELSGPLCADVIEMESAVSYWRNGAELVVFTPTASSGTGTMEGYCQIQKNGSQEGVNTNDKGVLNTKNGARRAFVQSGGTVVPDNALVVPVAERRGVDYLELVLDVNENDGVITLTQTQIWVLTDDSLTWEELKTITPSYELNMDTQTANDYVITENGAGSGKADLLFYLSLESLDLTPDVTYWLYQYSSFSGSSNGFEEWGVSETAIDSPHAPEPGSLVLLTTGAALLARRRRPLAVFSRRVMDGGSR